MGDEALDAELEMVQAMYAGADELEHIFQGALGLAQDQGLGARGGASGRGEPRHGVLLGDLLKALCGRRAAEASSVAGCGSWVAIRNFLARLVARRERIKAMRQQPGIN